MPVAAHSERILGVGMQEGIITVVGTAVSDTRHHTTADGHHVARFRIAVQPRRFDRASGRWVEQQSSFMSVVSWRALADNVGASISKGDPVVVSGRLRVREWESNGRQGTDVEIDATAIGHDLTRGVATFERVRRGVPPLPPIDAGELGRDDADRASKPPVTDGSRDDRQTAATSLHPGPPTCEPEAA